MILSFTTIRSVYENYKLGDRNEREELLTAVIFDVIKNQNISEEDIEDIHVAKHYDGVYPFNYEVMIDLKNKKRIIYQWENDEKNKVIITSS